MRRDRDARRKRTVQIVVGLFIAFLMVFSIFEYSMTRDSSADANYRGHSFSQDTQSRLFLTKVEGKTYFFYSLPPSLEGIPIDPAAVPLLKGAQVVIYTFDPKAPSIQVIEEVRYELSTTLPTQPVFAVTENDTAYATLPLLSCKDAAPYTPVVYLNVSDNASITVVGFCVVLNANATEFLSVRDRLLYTYLGVMT